MSPKPNHFPTWIDSCTNNSLSDVFRAFYDKGVDIKPFVKDFLRQGYSIDQYISLTSLSDATPSFTLLTLACFCQRFDIIQLLVEDHNASVNLQQLDTLRSPLAIICSQELTRHTASIAMYLIDHGADIHLPDVEGIPPLFHILACPEQYTLDHIVLVTYFLLHRVDMTSKTPSAKHYPSHLYRTVDDVLALIVYRRHYYQHTSSELNMLDSPLVNANNIDFLVAQSQIRDGNSPNESNSQQEIKTTLPDSRVLSQGLTEPRAPTQSISDSLFQSFRYRSLYNSIHTILYSDAFTIGVILLNRFQHVSAIYLHLLHLLICYQTTVTPLDDIVPLPTLLGHFVSIYLYCNPDPSPLVVQYLSLYVLPPINREKIARFMGKDLNSFSHTEHGLASSQRLTPPYDPQQTMYSSLASFYQGLSPVMSLFTSSTKSIDRNLFMCFLYLIAPLGYMHGLADGDSNPSPKCHAKSEELNKSPFTGLLTIFDCCYDDVFHDLSTYLQFSCNPSGDVISPQASNHDCVYQLPNIDTVLGNDDDDNDDMEPISQLLATDMDSSSNNNNNCWISTKLDKTIGYHQLATFHLSIALQSYTIPELLTGCDHFNCVWSSSGVSGTAHPSSSPSSPLYNSRFDISLAYIEDCDDTNTPLPDRPQSLQVIDMYQDPDMLQSGRYLQTIRRYSTMFTIIKSRVHHIQDALPSIPFQSQILLFNSSRIVDSLKSKSLYRVSFRRNILPFPNSRHNGTSPADEDIAPFYDDDDDDDDEHSDHRVGSRLIDTTTPTIDLHTHISLLTIHPSFADLAYTTDKFLQQTSPREVLPMCFDASFNFIDPVQEQKDQQEEFLATKVMRVYSTSNTIGIRKLFSHYQPANSKDIIAYSSVDQLDYDPMLARPTSVLHHVSHDDLKKILSSSYISTMNAKAPELYPHYHSRYIVNTVQKAGITQSRANTSLSTISLPTMYPYAKVHFTYPWSADYPLSDSSNHLQQMELPRISQDDDEDNTYLQTVPTVLHHHYYRHQQADLGITWNEQSSTVKPHTPLHFLLLFHPCLQLNIYLQEIITFYADIFGALSNPQIRLNQNLHSRGILAELDSWDYSSHNYLHYYLSNSAPMKNRQLFQYLLHLMTSHTSVYRNQSQLTPLLTAKDASYKADRHLLYKLPSRIPKQYWQKKAETDSDIDIDFSPGNSSPADRIIPVNNRIVPPYAATSNTNLLPHLVSAFTRSIRPNTVTPYLPSILSPWQNAQYQYTLFSPIYNTSQPLYCKDLTRKSGGLNDATDRMERIGLCPPELLDDVALGDDVLPERKASLFPYYHLNSFDKTISWNDTTAAVTMENRQAMEQFIQLPLSPATFSKYYPIYSTISPFNAMGVQHHKQLGIYADRSPHDKNGGPWLLSMSLLYSPFKPPPPPGQLQSILTTEKAVITNALRDRFTHRLWRSSLFQSLAESTQVLPMQFPYIVALRTCPSVHVLLSTHHKVIRLDHSKSSFTSQLGSHLPQPQRDRLNQSKVSFLLHSMFLQHLGSPQFHHRVWSINMDIATGFAVYYLSKQSRNSALTQKRELSDLTWVSNAAPPLYKPFQFNDAMNYLEPYSTSSLLNRDHHEAQYRWPWYGYSGVGTASYGVAHQRYLQSIGIPSIPGLYNYNNHYRELSWDDVDGGSYGKRSTHSQQQQQESYQHLPTALYPSVLDGMSSTPSIHLASLGAQIRMYHQQHDEWCEKLQRYEGQFCLPLLTAVRTGLFGYQSNSNWAASCVEDIPSADSPSWALNHQSFDSMMRQAYLQILSTHQVGNIVKDRLVHDNGHDALLNFLTIEIKPQLTMECPTPPLAQQPEFDMGDIDPNPVSQTSFYGNTPGSSDDQDMNDMPSQPVANHQPSATTAEHTIHRSQSQMAQPAEKEPMDAQSQQYPVNTVLSLHIDMNQIKGLGLSPHEYSLIETICTLLQTDMIWIDNHSPAMIQTIYSILTNAEISPRLCVVIIDVLMHAQQQQYQQLARYIEFCSLCELLTQTDLPMRLLPDSCEVESAPLEDTSHVDERTLSDYLQQFYIAFLCHPLMSEIKTIILSCQREFEDIIDYLPSPQEHPMHQYYLAHKHHYYRTLDSNEKDRKRHSQSEWLYQFKDIAEAYCIDAASPTVSSKSCDHVSSLTISLNNDMLSLLPLLRPYRPSNKFYSTPTSYDIRRSHPYSLSAPPPQMHIPWFYHIYRILFIPDYLPHSTRGQMYDKINAMLQYLQPLITQNQFPLRMKTHIDAHSSYGRLRRQIKQDTQQSFLHIHQLKQDLHQERLQAPQGNQDLQKTSWGLFSGLGWIRSERSSSETASSRLEHLLQEENVDIDRQGSHLPSPEDEIATQVTDKWVDMVECLSSMSDDSTSRTANDTTTYKDTFSGQFDAHRSNTPLHATSDDELVTETLLYPYRYQLPPSELYHLHKITEYLSLLVSHDSQLVYDCDDLEVSSASSANPQDQTTHSLSPAPQPTPTLNALYNHSAIFSRYFDSMMESQRSHDHGDDTKSRASALFDISIHEYVKWQVYSQVQSVVNLPIARYFSLQNDQFMTLEDHLQHAPVQSSSFSSTSTSDEGMQQPQDGHHNSSPAGVWIHDSNPLTEKLLTVLDGFIKRSRDKQDVGKNGSQGGKGRSQRHTLTASNPHDSMDDTDLTASEDHLTTSEEHRIHIATSARQLQQTLSDMNIYTPISSIPLLHVYDYMRHLSISMTSLFYSQLGVYLFAMLSFFTKYQLYAIDPFLESLLKGVPPCQQPYHYQILSLLLGSPLYRVHKVNWKPIYSIGKVASAVHGIVKSFLPCPAGSSSSSSSSSTVSQPLLDIVSYSASHNDGSNQGFCGVFSSADPINYYQQFNDTDGYFSDIETATRYSVQADEMSTSIHGGHSDTNISTANVSSNASSTTGQEVNTDRYIFPLYPTFVQMLPSSLSSASLPVSDDKTTKQQSSHTYHLTHVPYTPPKPLSSPEVTPPTPLNSQRLSYLKSMQDYLYHLNYNHSTKYHQSTILHELCVFICCPIHKNARLTATTPMSIYSFSLWQMIWSIMSHTLNFTARLAIDLRLYNPTSSQDSRHTTAMADQKTRLSDGPSTLITSGDTSPSSPTRHDHPPHGFREYQARQHAQWSGGLIFISPLDSFPDDDVDTTLQYYQRQKRVIYGDADTRQYLYHSPPRPPMTHVTAIYCTILRSLGNLLQSMESPAELAAIPPIPSHIDATYGPLQPNRYLYFAPNASHMFLGQVPSRRDVNVAQSKLFVNSFVTPYEPILPLSDSVSLVEQFFSLSVHFGTNRLTSGLFNQPAPVPQLNTAPTYIFPDAHLQSLLVHEEYMNSSKSMQQRPSILFPLGPSLKFDYVKLQFQQRMVLDPELAHTDPALYKSLEPYPNAAYISSPYLPRAQDGYRQTEDAGQGKNCPPTASYGKDSSSGNGHSSPTPSFPSMGTPPSIVPVLYHQQLTRHLLKWAIVNVNTLGLSLPYVMLITQLIYINTPHLSQDRWLLSLLLRSITPSTGTSIDTQWDQLLGGVSSSFSGQDTDYFEYLVHLFCSYDFYTILTYDIQNHGDIDRTYATIPPFLMNILRGHSTPQSAIPESSLDIPPQTLPLPHQLARLYDKFIRTTPRVQGRRLHPHPVYGHPVVTIDSRYTMLSSAVQYKHIPPLLMGNQLISALSQLSLSIRLLLTSQHSFQQTHHSILDILLGYQQYLTQLGERYANFDHQQRQMLHNTLSELRQEVLECLQKNMSKRKPEGLSCSNEHTPDHHVGSPTDVHSASRSSRCIPQNTPCQYYFPGNKPYYAVLTPIWTTEETSHRAHVVRSRYRIFDVSVVLQSTAAGNTPHNKDSRANTYHKQTQYTSNTSSTSNVLPFQPFDTYDAMVKLYAYVLPTHDIVLQVISLHRLTQQARRNAELNLSFLQRLRNKVTTGVAELATSTFIMVNQHVIRPLGQMLSNFNTKNSSYPLCVVCRKECADALLKKADDYTYPTFNVMSGTQKQHKKPIQIHYHQNSSSTRIKNGEPWHAPLEDDPSMIYACQHLHSLQLELPESMVVGLLTLDGNLPMSPRLESFLKQTQHDEGGIIVSPHHLNQMEQSNWYSGLTILLSKDIRSTLESIKQGAPVAGQWCEYDKITNVRRTLSRKLIPRFDVHAIFPSLQALVSDLLYVFSNATSPVCNGTIYNSNGRINDTVWRYISQKNQSSAVSQRTSHSTSILGLVQALLSSNAPISHSLIDLLKKWLLGGLIVLPTPLLIHPTTYSARPHSIGAPEDVSSRLQLLPRTYTPYWTSTSEREQREDVIKPFQRSYQDISESDDHFNQTTGTYIEFLKLISNRNNQTMEILSHMDSDTVSDNTKGGSHVAFNSHVDTTLAGISVSPPSNNQLDILLEVNSIEVRHLWNLIHYSPISHWYLDSFSQLHGMDDTKHREGSTRMFCDVQILPPGSTNQHDGMNHHPISADVKSTTTPRRVVTNPFEYYYNLLTAPYYHHEPYSPQSTLQKMSETTQYFMFPFQQAKPRSQTHQVALGHRIYNTCQTAVPRTTDVNVEILLDKYHTVAVKGPAESDSDNEQVMALWQTFFNQQINPSDLKIPSTQIDRAAVPSAFALPNHHPTSLPSGQPSQHNMYAILEYYLAHINVIYRLIHLSDRLSDHSLVLNRLRQFIPYASKRFDNIMFALIQPLEFGFIDNSNMLSHSSLSSIDMDPFQFAHSCFSSTQVQLYRNLLPIIIKYSLFFHYQRGDFNRFIDHQSGTYLGVPSVEQHAIYYSHYFPFHNLHHLQSRLSQQIAHHFNPTLPRSLRQYHSMSALQALYASVLLPDTPLRHHSITEALLFHPYFRIPFTCFAAMMLLSGAFSYELHQKTPSIDTMESHHHQQHSHHHHDDNTHHNVASQDIHHYHQHGDIYEDPSTKTALSSLDEHLKTRPDVVESASNFGATQCFQLLNMCLKKGDAPHNLGLYTRYFLARWSASAFGGFPIQNLLNGMIDAAKMIDDEIIAIQHSISYRNALYNENKHQSRLYNISHHQDGASHWFEHYQEQVKPRDHFKQYVIQQFLHFDDYITHITVPASSVHRSTNNTANIQVEASQSVPVSTNTTPSGGSSLYNQAHNQGYGHNTIPHATTTNTVFHPIFSSPVMRAYAYNVWVDACHMRDPTGTAMAPPPAWNIPMSCIDISQASNKWIYSTMSKGLLWYIVHTVSQPTADDIATLLFEVSLDGYDDFEQIDAPDDVGNDDYHHPFDDSSIHSSPRDGSSDREDESLDGAYFDDLYNENEHGDDQASDDGPVHSQTPSDHSSHLYASPPSRRKTRLDVYAVNENGETILMHAILRRWSSSCLLFLIQTMGVDHVVATKDSRGRTAYDYMLICQTYAYAPEVVTLVKDAVESSEAQQVNAD